MAGMVDAFVLPPPTAVAHAFYTDFTLLMEHSASTLLQAFIGLGISIVSGYGAALGMDRFDFLRKALYPLLILSQTVPYIAVAPLLVLWLGYGMAPKIALVSLTCFFPIAVNVYDGISSIQQEYIDEFKVMGGSYLDGLRHFKLQLSLPSFFSAVKIATTYTIVGSVIAEWIGGSKGLGVYMTRVRRSFEFDKMFAVIFFIVLMSLLLMAVVKLLEKRFTKDVI